MTLISDDGYDIVVENYQLVGVTGPTMNISGADEDFANLTDGSTQFSDNATDYYSPIPLQRAQILIRLGFLGQLSFTLRLYSRFKLVLKEQTKRHTLLPLARLLA